ncbi:MAG: hypothetical protein N2485_08310 [bacterium]|nr:hypothetical protein [bacterium]
MPIDMYQYLLNKRLQEEIKNNLQNSEPVLENKEEHVNNLQNSELILENKGKEDGNNLQNSELFSENEKSSTQDSKKRKKIIK